MTQQSLNPTQQHSESVAAPNQLEIIVLFTDVPSTLAALRTAAQLAQGLATRIRLLALQCVPFPLPLDQPPIDIKFLNRRFRTMVESSSPVDTVVDIQLCRDTADTLRSRLSPRSVVVIGKRSRWWPKPEDWLARQLRREGHHVIRAAFHRTVSHA